MNLYKLFSDISISQALNMLIEVFRAQPNAKGQLLTFTLRFQYSSTDDEIDANLFLTFLVKCSSNYVFIGGQEKRELDPNALEYLSYHDSGWRTAIEGYCRKKAGELTERFPDKQWHSFNSFWKTPKWIDGDIRVDDHNSVTFIQKKQNGI